LSVDEPERRLAVVRSYDELHAVMRARVEELQVTRESIDNVTGLQSGYAGKLLAPIPIKSLGRTSMGPMLEVLGLALVVVEDPESLEKYADRLEKRERKDGMHKPVEHRGPTLRETRAAQRQMLREALRKVARKGGLKSALVRGVRLSPAQRRRIAKRAARARWRRQRSTPAPSIIPTGEGNPS
jgi:hypothetical protein